MALTTLTTNGRPGDLAVIAGTGLGSTQGTSVVLFFPNGDTLPEVATVTSWSATSITTTVPTDAKVGATGFFVVQLNGGPGDKSQSFVVLPQGRPTFTGYYLPYHPVFLVKNYFVELT